MWLENPETIFSYEILPSFNDDFFLLKLNGRRAKIVCKLSRSHFAGLFSPFAGHYSIFDFLLTVQYDWSGNLDDSYLTFLSHTFERQLWFCL